MFRRMCYLQRRGGMFWIRHMVPSRLQSILGKREILVPLRTGDEKTAQVRLLVELPKVKRTLANAERALTDPTVAQRLALKADTARPRTDEEDEALDSYLTTQLEDDERAGRAPSPVALALLKRDEDHGPTSMAKVTMPGLDLSALHARGEAQR